MKVIKIQKLFFFTRCLSPPRYLCPPPPFIDLNTTDQAKECVGGDGFGTCSFTPQVQPLEASVLRGKTASAGRDKGRVEEFFEVGE